MRRAHLRWYPEQWMDVLSRRAAGALVLMGALLYATPLALNTPLIDPDEGLHASISQEMVERGDLVTPRFLGEPFLDKPVLFFWTQAASLRLFGMNEAAVRLPGLAFGLLGAITTGWLAAMLLGRVAGVLAGAFYATLLLPLALDQAGAHDVALVVWINLALIFLWRAAAAARSSVAAREAVLAGVSLGLGGLTKGLAPAVFVYLAFGITIVLFRRLSPRVAGAVALSAATAFLVALPWYLAMERLHAGYLHYYFVERHLQGFVGATQRHGGGDWWYYGPLLLAGAFPWIMYLPSSIAALRGEDMTRRMGVAFAWVWLVAGLLFLSTASSKLATYALPLCPPVAMLAAAVWAERIARRSEEPYSRGFSVPIVAHAVIALVVPIVAMVVVQRRFQAEYSAAIWLGYAAIALAAAAMFRERRVRPRIRTVAVGLALVTVTALFGIVGLLPAVAARNSARDLAAYFNRAGTFPERLRLFEDRVGSVVFYLDPATRAKLTPERLDSFGAESLDLIVRANPDRLTVAVRERRLDVFERLVDPDAVPYRRAGQFRLYDVEALSRAGVGALARPAGADPPSSAVPVAWRDAARRGQAHR
jgi:4-amino-4-deoxy-L-arabinose transferase-like glycosyltransferase